MGTGGSHENVEESLIQPENHETLTHEVKKYIDNELLAIKMGYSSKKKDLKNELARVKADYDSLLNKHTELAKSHRDILQTGLEVKEVSSIISEEAIDKFVEDYLNSPSVQHGYLTEAVEGVVYRKALKSALHAVAAAADTAKVELINHELVFSLRPINREPQNKN